MHTPCHSLPLHRRASSQTFDMTNSKCKSHWIHHDMMSLLTVASWNNTNDDKTRNLVYTWAPWPLDHHWAVGLYSTESSNGATCEPQEAKQDYLLQTRRMPKPPRSFEPTAPASADSGLVPLPLISYCFPVSVCLSVTLIFSCVTLEALKTRP